LSLEKHTAEEYARYIAESVAAMAMLKDQICGMYAALEQKGKNQSDHVQAFANAEARLRQLLSQFPKDPITLAGINQASAQVEIVATQLPKDLKHVMDGLGSKVAGDFGEAVRDDIGKINEAANRATQAAHEYVEQTRRSYWKTALLALVVSLAMAGALVTAALYWWIPARADVEAQRAEVAHLTAAVAQLKQQGGDAQVIQCETRLCVRTDESGKTPKVADAKKGETYRVIKGY